MSRVSKDPVLLAQEGYSLGQKNEPFMPAYAPDLDTYSARGRVGQLFEQSDSEAVSTITLVEFKSAAIIEAL